MTITTLHGDCRHKLQEIAERSVQCVVTSPPYYGLRRYSDDPREIGQEAQPDCLAWARKEPPCGSCYVCAMRDVFAGLWRVLRDDGTVWLNLGDSYNSAASNQNGSGLDGSVRGGNREAVRNNKTWKGLKQKDLLGIPWRVALALQADGWYLRSDIVWAKPNCMPESVIDRPTRAHEYVFLLAKSARYFYDSAAIAEPIAEQRPVTSWAERKAAGEPLRRGDPGESGHVTRTATLSSNPTRNKRTVWAISTQSYPGSHYATMPEALIEPCVLAGSSAQACEHCGAPWVRVVEKIEIDQEKTVSNPKQSHLGHGTSARVNTPEYGHAYVSTRRDTGGFAPSCACPENTGSAASIVLDPFCGSGTVLRVAARYQRNAIGIELNQEYIEEHVEQRTNGVQVEMTGLYS